MICNIWLTFNIAVNCITSWKASLSILCAFVLLLKSAYNTWKYLLSEDVFCNGFCKYYFFVQIWISIITVGFLVKEDSVFLKRGQTCYNSIQKMSKINFNYGRWLYCLKLSYAWYSFRTPQTLLTESKWIVWKRYSVLNQTVYWQQRNGTLKELNWIVINDLGKYGQD